MPESPPPPPPPTPYPGLDCKLLVPRIQNLQFLTSLRKLGIPEDRLPMTRPVVANLLQTLAFDLPDTVQLASRDALVQAGVSPIEAFDVALANVADRLRAGTLEESGEVCRLAAADHLSACMLLLGEYWEGLTAGWGSGWLASAPTRDEVFVLPNPSPAGVRELRARTALAFRADPEHALSDRLLVWREGRWFEYGE